MKSKSAMEAVWWAFLAAAIIVLVVVIVLLALYGKIQVGGETAIGGLGEELSKLWK
jgi:choline-glycine betaine transporter